MSSYLKKLAKEVNRINILRRLGTPVVWAYMVYACEDCGNRLFMYLEEGLEQGGARHKPVPFAIRCPKCGGFHCYDVTGLIKLTSGPRALNTKEHYFKNTPKDDCGIPVHPANIERNE